MDSLVADNEELMVDGPSWCPDCRRAKQLSPRTELPSNGSSSNPSPIR